MNFIKKVLFWILPLVVLCCSKSPDPQPAPPPSAPPTSVYEPPRIHPEYNNDDQTYLNPFVFDQSFFYGAYNKCGEQVPAGTGRFMTKRSTSHKADSVAQVALQALRGTWQLYFDAEGCTTMGNQITIEPDAYSAGPDLNYDTKYNMQYTGGVYVYNKITRNGYKIYLNDDALHFATAAEGSDRKFKVSYYYKVDRIAAAITPVLVTYTPIVAQPSGTGGGKIVSYGESSVIERGICWGTTNPPTISDFKSPGFAELSFISKMTNLLPGTTYFVRAYAVSAAGAGYGSIRTFTTMASPEVVEDIEGNKYNTVIIDSMVWMAENLKVTKMNDGTEIPLYYGYEKAFTSNDFGVFYRLKPDDNKKLCPAGWHVASSPEWNALPTEFALILESDFNAKADGYFNVASQSQEGVGTLGVWWAQNEAYKEFSICYNMHLLRFQENTFNCELGSQFRLSVRCVKD